MSRSSTTPRSTTDTCNDERRPRGCDCAWCCGPNIWDAAWEMFPSSPIFRSNVFGGEMLGIVGASGSGKSSLLRLLNRLDEPTSGTVFLDGQDYRQFPPRELRRRVGMVTQRPFLFPGNVAGNIRFGPLQRGEVLADEDIARLLERVGLPGFAGRDVSKPVWRRAATGFAGASAGQSSRNSAAR